MTANGWFQIGLYLLIIFAVAKPAGIFMARVFEREKTFLDPLLRPMERLLYRICGIDEQARNGLEGIYRIDAAFQRGIDAASLRDRAGAD